MQLALGVALLPETNRDHVHLPTPLQDLGVHVLVKDAAHATLVCTCAGVVSSASGVFEAGPGRRLLTLQVAPQRGQAACILSHALTTHSFLFSLQLDRDRRLGL